MIIEDEKGDQLLGEVAALSRSYDASRSSTFDLNGDGVTHQFLFLLERDAEGVKRVRAMFVDASFEHG
ncbi:MAG: hypothetical protein JWM82_2629 [Myxococcales bacterium]|nr:hypothetical protein [Myxococcales bacterium]